MNYILSFFTSIFIVLIVNSEGEDIINLCPNGVFKCVSAKSLRICFHGQLVTSEFFCPNSTYCSEVADTICTQLEPITPSTDKSTITVTNSDSPNTRSTTQRFPETNSTNSDLISESTIVTRTSSNTDSHTHNDIETTSSATQGSTKTEEESSTTEELTTVIPECTKPGRFPILNTKCTKYILCVGTSHGFEQKIYTCPGNSTFDPLAQKCKLYNYCPEIPTTIAPTIGPSICTEAGKFPVSNTKCTEYILCVLTSNGFVQHIYKCPDNTTFDPLSKRCNTYYTCPENIPPTTTEVPTYPTESPKCTEAGKFPVSNTNCTEYILCVLTSNGFVHHTYKCPDNTTFDPSSKRCQMYYTCPENIPSTTTEVSTSTTEASKCTEAGKFPVPNTNCTEYILCVITSNGVVHHSYKCPNNTTFDPLSQKCKMYYTCPENFPPTTTETVPTGTTEIPICTEAGKFPVPNTNCTQFLLCVATSNGLMHQVFPCPDNTTFDPVAKKCKIYYECKEHLSSTTSTEPGTTVRETPTKPEITTVKDTPTEPTTDLNTSTEPVTKTTVRDTPTEPAPITTGKDTSTELVTTETSIVGTSTESVTTTTVQNTPKETETTTTTINGTPTESVISTTTVKDTSTEAVTTTTVEETSTEPETGTTVQNIPTESTTKSTIIDTSTESAVTTTTSKNTPNEPLTTTTEPSTTTTDLNTPTEPPTKTTVKDEITKPIATTTTTTKNTATEPVITTTELLTTPTVQNTTTEPATKTTVKDDPTEPAATSTTVRVTSTEAVPTTTDKDTSTKPTTIQSTSEESATETTVGDYLTESTVTTAESTPTEPVTSTIVEETTTESSATTIVQNTPTESSIETTESTITATTVKGTSTELPSTTEFETTTVDENTQTEPAATITTGKDISTVTTESGTTIVEDTSTESVTTTTFGNTVTASTTVKDTTINPLTTTTLQSSPDKPATTTVTDSPTESAATTTTIGNTVTELVTTTTTESAITTTIQNIPTESATEPATETTVTDSSTESAATTTIGNTVTELVTTTTTESATTTIQNIPTEPATETTVTDSPTESAATTTTIGNTVTEPVTTTTTESAITTTIQNTPTEPGTETKVTNMPTESAVSTTAVENIPTEPVTTTTTIKNTPAEPATESTVTDTQTEPGATISTVENIPTELVTTTTTIQNTPTEPATESTVTDTQTEPGVKTTTVENIPTEVVTTTTTIQNTPTEPATESTVTDTQTEPGTTLTTVENVPTELVTTTSTESAITTTIQITPTESATETSVEDTPTEPAAITTTKQDTTTEAAVSTTVNTPTEPPTKTTDTGTSTVPPPTTVKNSPTEPASTTTTVSLTPTVPESTIFPTVQSTPTQPPTTTIVGSTPTEPPPATTVEDSSPTTVVDTTTEQATSTSTVTTPSTLPECTKMGRFPVVNTNCTKYILCILTSQGYLRNEYECPPNSYFDPSVQRCNSFYVCPENPPTTPSTTEVTNPNDSQKCSAAGRFPVPNSNCTKYSLCSITSHGIIQSIYDCPTNTFFDPNAHRCKTYYTCPEITTIAPAIIREPTNCSEPGKFPIENTKCTKYLYCIMSSNGFLEQEIDCPQGSLFNPNTEKCSEAYRCPEDLGKIFQLEENQKIIPECTREGKFPVLGSNCGEYIFCTQTPRGLVGKTYQCPSKTKFDIDKHSCFRNTPCEEPYKIQNDTKCTAQEKLPILGTDCTKFLLCTKTESGFVSTEHTCHEGSLFNPLREQCSTSHVCNEDVKTKCTTIGLYPDSSDDKCEHYYECIEKDENIQGLRRKCKEGYAFDPEIQKCSASYKFHCRPRTRRDAFQQGLVSPRFLVNGRCTTTGRWLMDFTNCKNYVVCSFGGAGLIQRNFSCLGAVFDQQRQKCVNPATYTCPETVCNNNPLLLDLPNPNSRDCTTYISCEEVFDPSTGDLLGNRGVILYCPVNTRFNPETSACESTYVCPT